MSTNQPQFRAGADINTSTFVKISADNTVIPCVAGDRSDGVMHESSEDTPIPNADGDIAVRSGHSKRVYGLGEVCEIRVGTGGLSAGDKVKPDANAAGVATSTTGETFSAICLQAGASAGRAKVYLTHGQV